MNPIRRLRYEIVGLLNVFSLGSLARYISHLGLHAPEVLRTGKLTVVDAAMSGSITITYRGRAVNFPLDEIDAGTRLFDATSAFGGVWGAGCRNSSRAR